MHTARCRVIYGDTDKMGIVYHANYLRWFEMGRNELFRSLGLTYKEIEAKGVLIPVAEVYAKYVQPAQYDDLLDIETCLDPKLKGGVKFDYRIKLADTDQLLVTGYTKHACLDAGGKVVRPPRFITALIHAPAGKRCDAGAAPAPAA